MDNRTKKMKCKNGQKRCEFSGESIRDKPVVLVKNAVDYVKKLGYLVSNIKFLIFLFLLMPTITAFEFDNVKYYDEVKNEITISNSFGLGEDLATYKLMKNTDQCLTDCYAEGRVVLYSEGLLFSDFYFKDFEGSLVDVDYEIYIQKNLSREILVNDFSEVCDLEANKTSKNCYEVVNGSHIESFYYLDWVVYDDSILFPGVYYWRIEGLKNPKDSVDWVGSAFGEDLLEWAWWDSDWSKCRDIDITTSLNQDNSIMLVNLTGLTFSNVSEIRIINNSCDNNDTEVKSTVLRNGTDWAYITFLANLSGSGVTYSVYYDNPSSPVKSEELVEDWCEFQGDLCGWTNMSSGGIHYSNNNDGTINFTFPSGSSGVKSSRNIGHKSLVVRINSFIGAGTDHEVGLSTVTNGGSPVAQASTNDSILVRVDKRSGYPRQKFAVQDNVADDQKIIQQSSSNYGSNTWRDFWLDVDTSGYVNGSLWNVTDGGIVASVNSTRATTEATMSLGFYVYLDSFATYQTIDYVRAYDIESMYVQDSDMPSFVIGDEETSGDGINPNVTINTPLNITYSSLSVVFNVTSLDDIGISDCYYSLDSGFNISMSNSSTSPSYYNATNSTMTKGSHSVVFYCNDTSNNLNSSESIDFYIDDVVPILNVLVPENITYFSSSMVLNLTANENLSSCYYRFDYHGSNSTMDKYNETSYYKSVSGITEGSRWVDFYCNDTVDNLNITRISLYVNLSAPPTWDNLRNISHLVATSISESITASDESGIDTYLLNDTSVFNINSTSGLITNISNLQSIQMYHLNISVNDTDNNILSSVFYIDVVAELPIVPQANLTINGLNRFDMALELNRT